MDREYQPLEEERRRTYLLYYYCYYPEGDVPGTSPSSSSPIGFKEIRLLKELFGDHFFDKGAKDLKDEQVVRILLRLKASMKRSISMKCLLPHLKKFKILMESEVEYLSSSIYEPSEQAVRLMEYLMNLGSYGLATLYLSLMESSKEKLSPPAHYVLLGEIKEAVHMEMGLGAEEDELTSKPPSKQDPDHSKLVEGAIKGYLAVALTEDAAKALTANLGMAEMFGHIQPNLGKVVLYWMGENADWELRELVEGLVFSRSLGRHTTALCTADQDYSPPPGVFHFLLSFSAAEVAAIAEYLGYLSEEVGPIFHQDRGSKEQQVTLFLELWKIPDCGGQYILPIMHRLKTLAGVAEEKISKKMLAERTRDGLAHVFMNTRLRVDSKGTPHRSLDSSRSRYASTTTSGPAKPPRRVADTTRLPHLEMLGSDSSSLLSRQSHFSVPLSPKKGGLEPVGSYRNREPPSIVLLESDSEEEEGNEDREGGMEVESSGAEDMPELLVQTEDHPSGMEIQPAGMESQQTAVEVQPTGVESQPAGMEMRLQESIDAESESSQSDSADQAAVDGEASLNIEMAATGQPGESVAAPSDMNTDVNMPAADTDTSQHDSIEDGEARIGASVAPANNVAISQLADTSDTADTNDTADPSLATHDSGDQRPALISTSSVLIDITTTTPINTSQHSLIPKYTANFDEASTTGDTTDFTPAPAGFSLAPAPANTVDLSHAVDPSNDTVGPVTTVDTGDTTDYHVAPADSMDQTRPTSTTAIVSSQEMAADSSQPDYSHNEATLDDPANIPSSQSFEIDSPEFPNELDLSPDNDRPTLQAIGGVGWSKPGQVLFGNEIYIPGNDFDLNHGIDYSFQQADADVSPPPMVENDSSPADEEPPPSLGYHTTDSDVESSGAIQGDNYLSQPLSIDQRVPTSGPLGVMPSANTSHEEPDGGVADKEPSETVQDVQQPLDVTWQSSVSGDMQTDLGEKSSLGMGASGSEVVKELSATSKGDNFCPPLDADPQLLGGADLREKSSLGVAGSTSEAAKEPSATIQGDNIFDMPPQLPASGHFETATSQKSSLSGILDRYDLGKEPSATSQGDNLHPELEPEVDTPPQVSNDNIETVLSSENNLLGEDTPAHALTQDSPQGEKVSRAHTPSVKSILSSGTGLDYDNLSESPSKLSSVPPPRPHYPVQTSELDGLAQTYHMPPPIRSHVLGHASHLVMPGHPGGVDRRPELFHATGGQGSSRETSLRKLSVGSHEEVLASLKKTTLPEGGKAIVVNDLDEYQKVVSAFKRREMDEVESANNLSADEEIEHEGDDQVLIESASGYEERERMFVGSISSTDRSDEVSAEDVHAKATLSQGGAGVFDGRELRHTKVTQGDRVSAEHTQVEQLLVESPGLAEPHARVVQTLSQEPAQLEAVHDQVPARARLEATEHGIQPSILHITKHFSASSSSDGGPESSCESVRSKPRLGRHRRRHKSSLKQQETSPSSHLVSTQGVIPPQSTTTQESRSAGSSELEPESAITLQPPPPPPVSHLKVRSSRRFSPSDDGISSSSSKKKDLPLGVKVLKPGRVTTGTSDEGMASSTDHTHLSQSHAHPRLGKANLSLVFPVLSQSVMEYCSGEGGESSADDQQEFCSEDVVSAIQDSGGLDFLKALVASGANVNAPTKDGTYPIHLAIESGSMEKVAVLLEKPGINVNALCKVTGKSPLHLACERGDFDLTQLLVERGADVTVVDGRGLSVLHHPSTLKAPDVVTYLLHNGLEVDIKHQNGATPLCLAVQHSAISAIQLLLVKGANVNATWLVPEVEVVLTPLSLAAFCGREEVVALLVDAKADINAANKTMFPSVYFAVMGNHPSVLQFLLKQNDLDSTLEGLLSAFCLGVQLQHYECVELLVQKYKGGIECMLRDSLRSRKEHQSLFIHQYKKYLATQHPPPLNRPPNLPAATPLPLPQQPPEPRPTAATATPSSSSQEPRPPPAAATPSSSSQEPRPPPAAATPTSGAQDTPPSPTRPSRKLQEQAPTRKPSHLDSRDSTHQGGVVSGGGGAPSDRNRSVNTAAYNKYNAQESPIGHQGRGSLGGLDFLGGGGGGEGLSADVVQQLQLMQQLSGNSGGDVGDNRALGDALDILNEFVQISILAAIGVREDGQEYLIELATRSGLENIEGFFLSYFFQTEELLRTNRLFTNFMAGMPSPFLFLLQQNVLTKNDFYKVLRDMGRDDFPNQFALALHQFPGSDHLAYDGEVIFSSMFMQHLVFGMRQNSLGLAFQSGPSSLPTPQRDSRPPPSRPAITSGRKTEEPPVSKPQERAGGSAREVSHSKPVESARRDQPTGGRSGNRLGGGERSRSRLLDRDGRQLSPPRPPSEREGDQTATQQATNSLPTSLGGGAVQSVGVAPSVSWPLPASGPSHAQSDAVATPPSSSGIDIHPTSAGLATPSVGSATSPTTLATPPTSSVPAMPPPSSLTKLSGSATLLANSGQESQFEASPASTALVTATAATSILTSTSSTFTTPPVRSTEVVSMATASVSAAPLVKSAEASSQEVMEPNDLDQVTSTRSEERRTEEVVRASLTGGQSEGGVPVYTQATPTSSQATPTSSHATPTPPMAATCVSNSWPTHTFAVAASTNLHVVVSAMTSEPVSVLPTQVPTAYAPQASDVAHPLLTSTQGTISIQHSLPPNMVADQSLHHSLPTNGHPSAMPSPLDPPHVPSSQPSVHVMQSSPLTSLYYPPTSAAPPSLTPAHISIPLTHAQSHFMLGSNYSSTPSFSASNLSSKQTMTSSFGTSTSPSPSIPHQSSSSLNVPMQSHLPPSDSTSESHLTPPVQPGDRSLRGGEDGEDGVSNCVSLEDRRITEDFTLSQHVSYTEQWKALRSKGTASVKNKGGSLKSKSSLQIRNVTSSLPVMREGVLRREGIGSARANLRGKGSSTSSLPVVMGTESKITFPLSERRSLESTLLKHRHSPRPTKARPGGFSESPLHISATSSTTRIPLPSRIPRLVRKGKEKKSDDLSSTSTNTLMEDTGTTSSSRPASAKKSSLVKRGPSFLPASTRRRPHTEPLRRIARPASANVSKGETSGRLRDSGVKKQAGDGNLNQLKDNLVGGRGESVVPQLMKSGKKSTLQHDGPTSEHDGTMQCKFEQLLGTGKGTATRSKEHIVEELLLLLDSIPQMPLSENKDLFEAISTHASAKRKWTLLARYLGVSDEVIDGIKQSCHFKEEKCMKMLVKWRDSKHLSTTYARLFCALVNIQQYAIVSGAKKSIPNSAYDKNLHWSMHMINFPLAESALDAIVTEMTNESQGGMDQAEVTIQSDPNDKLSQPLEFRLLSLDSGGWRVLEYMLKAAAYDRVRGIVVTLQYLSS